MDETEIEKLASLSGRVASKLVGVLERRGYDIRGKSRLRSAEFPVALLQSQNRTTERRLSRANCVAGCVSKNLTVLGMQISEK
jgi:hypothetical protein